MKKLRLNADMTEGPLLPNIIMYTIPIILTGVLQLTFNAADLIVVGRFCGSESVAAVGATSALVTLLVNLFIGLSGGAGVTLAHALGSHNEEQAKRTVHTAIPLALISGIVLTFVGFFFSESFLSLMGTPESTLKLSSVYLKIYFLGITFNMLYNYSASILRAAGDTKSPLLFLTVAGVINVVLNVIFVTLLHMDVAGVALATTLSQVVSAILITRALIKRDDCCHLDIKAFKITKPELLKILRIGIPSGVQGSLFSISNVLIQSSVNSFGVEFMSGSAAAANIEGFVYITQNSFYHSALNFSGQNTGAKNYKRVRKAFFICLMLVTLVGFSLGALVCLFAKPLLSIYITDSTAAIEAGVVKLMFVCLPYFLCGLMEVSTGALRGMGVSLSTMVISLLGACGFRILWIYTIFQTPQFHTGAGLFVSYPISWLLTFATQFILFLFVYYKRTKKERELLK